WAYSPTLSRYDAEADVARLLLDEAGWLPGPNGVRQLEGTPLSFTLITSADPVHVEL
ncbi:MAG: hypothetical protein GWN84_22585, partial [Gammaproteobacteria bacterium]|nr:hypothetical protein [Gammaproteobacteria bacterium]NIR85999.1 hypothetical protein [Gammaproteobacteria bacterium]NIU06556.1 hypothetical protein [Gammaproteobacteria bacterium]NIV53445.1 hypothetical protein [Gammaproteobacteria bacterium]NIX87829.1 hypothetical protein [Gammaproteobacteria bacterium]